MTDQATTPSEGEGTPASEDAAATEPGAPVHRDDGLDLARAITRSTAGAATRPARRPRRAGGEGPRLDRTGRSGFSGAHPDDRDPQLLDTTLGRLVADHGWALDLRVHGLFARWAELVGEDVAAHCTPESFADGRLVVRTDSTAWATQLRLLAPRIVERLNLELGSGSVTLIDVQGPHLPSWKKGPRSVRDGRGPRDTYG
ncbi:DciA family protein [Nocardioides fonticola]|uniref:DciA family protein n=1 Tax=Nocardioides fonticola TaxID=450363 RepID=A0ABP7XRA7_9ACTN